MIDTDIHPRMVDEQKRALEEEIAEFQRRKVVNFTY